MSQKKKVKVQQYAAKQEKKAHQIVMGIIIGLILLATAFVVITASNY